MKITIQLLEKAATHKKSRKNRKC